MSPARISLALACLPHVAWLTPQVAAEARELLMDALGDRPIEPVALPDLSQAGGIVLSTMREIALEDFAEVSR
jgi:hypothetical protein